jgi:hypothetical protein
MKLQKFSDAIHLVWFVMTISGYTKKVQDAYQRAAKRAMSNSDASFAGVKILPKHNL